MLGTLSGDKKTDWPSYVAPLVYAYNSTKHGSTGYSPYYLMFGRKPRLTADVTLGLDKLEKEPKPYAAYADNLRAQLAHAYDLASEAMHKRAEYNKKSYDRYAKENSLKAGDRVLVRNLSTRGKHKLQDRWEATPYIIIRKVRELPVYTPSNQRVEERREYYTETCYYHAASLRDKTSRREGGEHQVHVGFPSWKWKMNTMKAIMQVKKSSLKNWYSPAAPQ